MLPARLSDTRRVNASNRSYVSIALAIATAPNLRLGDAPENDLYSAIEARHPKTLYLALPKSSRSTATSCLGAPAWFRTASSMTFLVVCAWFLTSNQDFEGHRRK